MLPFSKHNTNQPTPPSSMPQQVVGGTNNVLPNLMQLQSQLGFVNPQSINNTNSMFMNIPNFNALQNAQLGNSILGSQQFQPHPGFSPQSLNLLGFPANGQFSNLAGQGNPTQFLGNNNNNNNNPLNNNGQFGWQNQLQQLSNSPLLNLNPAQVNALTQLLGCANQVAQAMNQQNAAFLGNSNSQQLGFCQPNVALQQGNFGQQMPVHSQQMQNVSVPHSNPAVSSHQHGQSSNFQCKHGQRQGLHSNQNKNFMKNSKREAFGGRFQKSQNHNLQNSKGKLKSFNSNEGIKDGADSSANQIKTGKQRSLAVLYTEKEIQQWREQRKKNYPSKANVDKKQANAVDSDEAATLRRQQLKDVLAKQAELGFEVPEIPSHYLSDSEQQTHRRDESRKGRFQNNGQKQNRFNRGGNFDRRDRFASKRGTENDGSSKKHKQYLKKQRVENDDSPKTNLSARKPTLLQKLLSTDIKRDQNRLLQAFRFMVINFFFKDYPEKPLIFPKVIVDENGVDCDVVEEKSTLFTEQLGNIEDHDVSDDDDGDGKNNDPQEEGEITD